MDPNTNGTAVYMLGVEVVVGAVVVNLDTSYGVIIIGFTGYD